MASAVVDEIGDDADGPLRALLSKPRPADYHGPEVREFNGDQPHGLHQKNLLIDGRYDDKPNQKIVFTGSYNFTDRSVRRNDETWLQINDPGVHDSRTASAHTASSTTRTSATAGSAATTSPTGERPLTAALLTGGWSCRSVCSAP